MEIKNIYMDNNSTTPLHPEVKKTLVEALDVFGNPSSFHSYGRTARFLIEDTRIKVADFIGASAEEIIFTGSGSEANNTVLSLMSCTSKYCAHNKAYRRGIVTTSIEHPCILEISKCLIDRGVPVSYARVDKYGKIDIDGLKNLIAKNTGLASVMMANNEIGTIQDIKAIAQLVHERGALFHTDAVQAAGKIKIDVEDLGVDFLTLSGHKIYGPKGIGVLYVKKSIPFCPFIRGGHQEMGRRAGTENTLGIIGLGKAIEMREKEMADEEKRLIILKAVFKDGIQKRIPDINFNGHPVDSLAGTLNISFDGAEGEAVLLYLDLEGIAVSTGSACASGSLDPSHVLLATGLGAEKAHGSIRFSLGRENTMEDVEYVLDKLPRVIKKVRSMSTAYMEKRR